MRLTPQDRLEIAQRRILSVLKAQTVVNLRTLEQKISDAGPNPQRVQPHVLTPAKAALLKEGRIVLKPSGNAQWIHLSDADPAKVELRLQTLLPIWEAFTSTPVARRSGQTLEIAIFRAILAANDMTPIGGFENVDDDNGLKLLSKQEVHRFNGKSIGKEALDFLVASNGQFLGVEAKNVRPWLYPHDSEIRAALRKCLTLGLIPVIIGRRIPYVSFKILGTCGVIMHETYNQRMANADGDLAEKAKHKDLLGYHDIRLGNAADVRLLAFFSVRLPQLLLDAKQNLDRFHDLLWAYANNEIEYAEFAARVRRRKNGQNEDYDWLGAPEPEPYDED